MDQLNKSQIGLRLAAGAVMASGLLVGLAAHPMTGLPAHLLTDALAWPMDGAQTGAAVESRLLAAISGGVMLGWGALVWMLAGRPFARDPDGIGRAIRLSVLIWFAADSLGSAVAGVPLNVMLNAALLGLFLWPLRRVSLSEQAA